MAQTVAPVATDDGPAKAARSRCARPRPPRPLRLAGWRVPARWSALVARAAPSRRWPSSRWSSGRAARRDLVAALLAPLGAWDGDLVPAIARARLRPDPRRTATPPPSSRSTRSTVRRAARRAAVRPTSSSSAPSSRTSPSWPAPAALAADARALRRGDRQRASRGRLLRAAVAFVFSTVYTESLFLLLVVRHVPAARAPAHRPACVVAALAVADAARRHRCSLPAIAWRMWDDNGRRFDRALARRAVPLLLLPAGRTRASRRTSGGAPGCRARRSSRQERGWGRQAEPLLVLALPLAIVHGLWQSGAAPRDLQELHRRRRRHDRGLAPAARGLPAARADGVPAGRRRGPDPAGARGHVPGLPALRHDRLRAGLAAGPAREPALARSVAAHRAAGRDGRVRGRSTYGPGVYTP